MQCPFVGLTALYTGGHFKCGPLKLISFHKVTLAVQIGINCINEQNISFVYFFPPLFIIELNDTIQLVVCISLSRSLIKLVKY